MGILGIEMESRFILECNLVKSVRYFTVSDHILRDEATTEERQNSFTQMMEIALEIAE